MKYVPKGCGWLADGMDAIRSLKSKEAYETTENNLVHFATPFVGIINDIYTKKSLKEGTKNERALGGSMVHVKGVKQHIVHGMRWQEFLHSNENKEYLITLVAKQRWKVDKRKHY